NVLPDPELFSLLVHRDSTTLHHREEPLSIKLQAPFPDQLPSDPLTIAWQACKLPFQVRDHHHVELQMAINLFLQAWCCHHLLDAAAIRVDVRIAHNFSE